MLYKNPKDWANAPHRRVALFGMSGLGKTHIANMLRGTGNWFHYSVDFRIGTRYMGEHIVDNFKHHAMQDLFLRDLLLSDSIYIASNISFSNLAPLSTYLGKPGDVARGGISFDTYVERQRQHRAAETAATIDAALFSRKAIDIYGYNHFIADCSGSLCEVVDPADAQDKVLCALSATALPVWIRGTDEHLDQLVERFTRAPKPMYYTEEFLRQKWAEFLALHGTTSDQVDPDAFIAWGFRQLMDYRLPRYEAMAQNWGVTIEATEAAALRDAQDFEQLIGAALARKNT